MKQLRTMCGILLIIFLMIPVKVYASSNPIKVGDPFPDIKLPIPKDPSYQKYLGVSGEGTFGIQDVKAEVVIIQIYFSGCAHCQKEAPVVNKVYRILQANRKFKNKIKILGIGVNDDIHMVKFVHESWKVKFPLFPDKELIIHKKVGSPGTPFFICAKINEKGGIEIFHTQLGEMTAADEFINTIVDKSGIDK